MRFSQTPLGNFIPTLAPVKVSVCTLRAPASSCTKTCGPCLRGRVTYRSAGMTERTAILQELDKILRALLLVRADRGLVKHNHGQIDGHIESCGLSPSSTSIRNIKLVMEHLQREHRCRARHTGTKSAFGS